MSLILWIPLVVVEAAAETQTLNFTNFDELRVASGIRVSIRQGNTYRVTASGTSDDLRRLDVRQKGHHLEFSMPSGFLSWFRPGSISVDITMPALRSLSLSGGSEGTLGIQIGSQPFRADLSGGSKLSGEIRSGDIDLNLSGGSRVTLSGSARRLSAAGSGGSKFDLRDLAATDVTASLSGGSDVIYHENARLGSVTTSGGSQVRRGR
jgi:hypothetical protein